METTARGRSGVVEEMLRSVNAEAVAATLFWCVCSGDGRSNVALAKLRCADGISVARRLCRWMTQMGGVTALVGAGAATGGSPLLTTQRDLFR